MINQIDQKWWFKLNGLLRLMYVKGYLSPLFDSLVVTEYPKSGGTWLSQLLASSTGVTYPRNKLPELNSSVIHGCFLDVSKRNKTVVLNRDGRDIMVSFYFHSLVKKARVSEAEVERITRDLGFSDVSNIEQNLPAFIEYSFSGKTYPRFTWTDFVRQWHGNKAVVHTSYEALNSNTVAELTRILSELELDTVSAEKINNAVAEFSFEKQAGRKKGAGDSSSFLRKGIVGDWKSSFSREAREIFNHYAGEELILLGYENNKQWVQPVASENVYEVGALNEQ